MTGEYIAWFVDDQLYHIYTRAEASRRGCTWVFNKSFHLILNLAVGGYWPGPPDNTTQFPARMFIDWIKIYRVNEPAYMDLARGDDVADELIARSRGFPPATFEKVINGGFDEPVDFHNSPVSNPDNWYLAGRLDVLDEQASGASGGLLKLVLKHLDPGSIGLKLGQVVWVRQGKTFALRIRAWSTSLVDAALRVSVPIYPAQIINETSFQLSSQQMVYELVFENPLGGPNVVEISLVINAVPESGAIVFVDEISLCELSTCPSIPEQLLRQHNQLTRQPVQQRQQALPSQKKNRESRLYLRS